MPPTVRSVDGAVTVPAVIVKFPPVSADEVPKLHAPPEPLKVSVLNLELPTILPVIVLPVVVAVNVTVALRAVNTPADFLSQFPPTERL